MTDQDRISAGVPAGGQFASHDRADGDVELSAPAPPTVERRFWIALGGDRYVLDENGERMTFGEGLEAQRYAAANGIGRFIQEQIPGIGRM